MPAFGDRLSDDQIADVPAYLETLPDGPRNFGPEMADRGGMMRDGEMMNRMRGGGWGWVWILIGVLLIVLVIAAAVVSSASEASGKRT